jgi:hypothetical protein
VLNAVKPHTLLKDCIDNILLDAYQNLVDFPLKPMLKALKEHPEGVSPDYFNNQKYDGVDMSSTSAMGPVMKSSIAIIYRIDLKKYQLMSTAHKTALKTYSPKISYYYRINEIINNLFTMAEIKAPYFEFKN